MGKGFGGLGIERELKRRVLLHESWGSIAIVSGEINGILENMATGYIGTE